MVLRKLARDWESDVSPLGYSFRSLLARTDRPDHFEKYRPRYRGRSLLFCGLLGGAILLVPIHSHVRMVDQGDILMMGI